MCCSHWHGTNAWTLHHSKVQMRTIAIECINISIVLFGALGLAALLIVLMAPLVLVGPSWFRQYTGIIVLGTTLYAMLGRFLNNDITGAVMLVVWLSLLLTQSLVGKHRT